LAIQFFQQSLLLLALLVLKEEKVNAEAEIDSTQRESKIDLYGGLLHEEDETPFLNLLFDIL